MRGDFMRRGQKDLLNGSLAAKQLRSLEVNIDTVKRISKIKGFTLAEVLITLAIIGVVAALTMPTLMANHRKKVTITRLQKFYSAMNQAIKLSEVQNGEIKYWESENLGFNPDNTLGWYEKYLQPYMNIIGTEKTSDGALVKQSDGSAFGIYMTPNGTPHIIYCVEYKACNNYIENSDNKLYDGANFDGKNTFLFVIENNQLYTYGGDGSLTRDELINDNTYRGYGCSKGYKVYCAALIQHDGWQIADDYPVKF